MKNLFTCLIGVILFVTANAQAPQLNWAKSFNGKSASTDSTSVMKMYILDKSIYIAGTSDAYGKGNDIVLIKRDYVTGDTLWTRHYNGTANGDDQAVDLEINQTTGDVYVTGKSMGLGTGYDIVTLKYSATGILGWANRWDNTSYHGDDIPKNIGIDGDGKIIVSAQTFNGNNAGAFYSHYEDLLILVYSSNGSLINYPKFNIGNTTWNYAYENSIDLIGGAKVSNNGGVFVAGEFMWGSLSNGISFVFEYGLKVTSSNMVVDYYSGSCTGGGILDVEATGFPMAAASTPDDLNFFNALDLDNSNNVYLAYLNDTIYGVGTGYTIGIAKINSLGCTVWENHTGKNANYKNLRVNAIKADATGNVYAAGYEKNSSGNFDWFVIKYNSAGVFQWRKTKNGTGNGNDIPYDIAFDEFQNPVVVGITKNTGTNNDITFVKYNKTNGAELFSVNYDSNNGDEKAYNIIVDASQNIIVNGIVNTASQSQNMITLRYCNPLETPTVTQITLNNINALQSNASTGNQWYNQNGLVNGATTPNYSPTTSGDYYVIVSVNGCTSNSSNAMPFIPTGIDPTESAKSLKVYPNPVTNELTIEMEGNTDKTNFEILNSLGQVVFNGIIFEKTVIQTTSFTSGVYLIKLESGKTFEFKKIIKN